MINKKKRQREKTLMFKQEASSMNAISVQVLVKHHLSLKKAYCTLRTRDAFVKLHTGKKTAP